MKPWMYMIIGVTSWRAFVGVIAPDISFARNAIAGFLGLTAVLSLAGAISRSINVHPQNNDGKTIQDEVPN